MGWGYNAQYVAQAKNRSDALLVHEDLLCQHNHNPLRKTSNQSQVAVGRINKVNS
jgi:hypothetical protein